MPSDDPIVADGSCGQLHWGECAQNDHVWLSWVRLQTQALVLHSLCLLSLPASVGSRHQLELAMTSMVMWVRSGPWQLGVCWSPWAGCSHVYQLDVRQIGG